MPTMPSPALALVLLLLAASIAASQAGFKCLDSPASPSAAPPPPTSNTTNSSAFRANVLTLLKTLPQAAVPTGFANLSLGTGLDGAFVRGLCHADSTLSECLAILQEAVRDFGDMCASSRSVAAWYDKCWITYADTNDLIGYEEHLSEVVCDGNSVSDLDSYDRTYNELMKRLVAQAANGSAMFATGEAVYAPRDPNGTMYGVVECMRDLSAAECGRCLQLLVPKLPTYCLVYQMAHNFNCRLRVQVYTYHDQALDAPLGE